MTRRPEVRVRFTTNPMTAYVSGFGSRALLTELRKRPPLWSRQQRAWVTTARIAGDLLAVAEWRGIATSQERVSADG